MAKSSLRVDEKDFPIFHSLIPLIIRYLIQGASGTCNFLTPRILPYYSR
jgi:hypothetical protein